MTAPLGTARDYVTLQAVLRVRADALGISRETIDRLAGVPAGYAAKTLAEVPIKRLGPDTLGPMLGALGVMMMVVVDDEAAARYSANADKRVEKYALNAAYRSGAVMFKINLKTLRRRGRKGGKNSRAYMSPEEATRLGKLAVAAREAKRQARKQRRVCVAAVV